MGSITAREAACLTSIANDRLAAAVARLSAAAAACLYEDPSHAAQKGRWAAVRDEAEHARSAAQHRISIAQDVLLGL